MLSNVERFLQDSLAHDKSLQYAVFLPKEEAQSSSSAAGFPRAVNLKEIDHLIHLHGLDELPPPHTAQEQVRFWDERMPHVREFFATAAKEAPKGPNGVASLTRVVFDVEVGGLFYAPIGDHGWVYAATFDQQPLNTGRSEQHLIRLVAGIGHLLSGSPANAAGATGSAQT